MNTLEVSVGKLVDTSKGSIEAIHSHIIQENVLWISELAYCIIFVNY